MKGSPPQVRGKPCGRITEVSHERITPAGAGKTQPHADRHAANQDHPRRCGENAAARRQTRSKSGSPPQVRGKQLMLVQHAIIPRITPAGAGKTTPVMPEAVTTADHPRRCGENSEEQEPMRGKIGSPPQVRGKRKSPARASNLRRITPAGAGKTLKRSFRNQPFCSRAVQISFNFSNSLNVSLQSGSAR